MTDLLTTDTYDSGEIHRLNPSIVETAVIEFEAGQRTQVLRPYDFAHPTLRLPVTARHAKIVVPDTIGVVDFEPRPTGPSAPPPMPAPPAPPQPSWAAQAGEWPEVRPRGYRPQRRRDRSAAWGVLTGVGGTLAVQAACLLGFLLVVSR